MKSKKENNNNSGNKNNDLSTPSKEPNSSIPLIRRKNTTRTIEETKSHELFIKEKFKNKTNNKRKPFKTISLTEEEAKLLKVVPRDKVDLKPPRIKLKVHTFANSSLNDVLDAINNRTDIEGIDIPEKLKDPNFIFRTLDNEELSMKFSKALSTIYQSGRTSNPQLGELGREKSKKNAENFAIQMYDIVKSIQEKGKLTTFRETIQALNENNIPSYRGGVWHLGTLHELNKRWEKLGYDPIPPKQ